MIPNGIYVGERFIGAPFVLAQGGSYLTTPWMNEGDESTVEKLTRRGAEGISGRRFRARWWSFDFITDRWDWVRPVATDPVHAVTLSTRYRTGRKATKVVVGFGLGLSIQAAVEQALISHDVRLEDGMGWSRLWDGYLPKVPRVRDPRIVGTAMADISAGGVGEVRLDAPAPVPPTADLHRWDESTQAWVKL